MEKVLTFQLSLFGNFVNIKPIQEITMNLVEKLKDEYMVPGTANVALVDPQNKNIVTEARLQMVSQSNDWKIVFFKERIDLLYEYMENNEEYCNLNDIFSRGIQILTKAFSVFPETLGNRIAINTNIILPKMDVEKEKCFIRKYTMPVSAYNNDKLEEWNLHYNVKKELFISKKTKEICNNIISLSQILYNNSKEVESRIVIGLDMNTLPENQEFRFMYTDLISFSEPVKNEMSKILSEIEEG